MSYRSDSGALPSGAHVVSTPNSVEKLQRQFVRAVAQLAKIHEELQRAQWVRDYENAQSAEPFEHLLGQGQKTWDSVGTSVRRRPATPAERGNR
jgi:cysteine synthase